MNSTSDKPHYFGYQPVSSKVKTERVMDVFEKTASHYDLMNHCMSLGLHIVWKKHTIEKILLRPGQRVLDLACGSCDLSYYLLKKYPKHIHIVAADPSIAMLTSGRSQLLDHGFWSEISFCLTRAEALPFKENSFDAIMIGFGFRNFTDQSKALHELHRVLRPGGTLNILEFSKPKSTWMQTVYHAYSQYVIPTLGAWVANDRDSYQYLVESIDMHPDANTLADTIVSHGFSDLSITPMTDGIVCLHQGIKRESHA